MIQKFNRALVIGACSFGLAAFGPAVQGQEAEIEGKARVGEAEAQTEIDIKDRHGIRDYGQTDRERSELDRPHREMTKVSLLNELHKASKIIGAEVRNDRHEHLGEIQDIVLDLEKGRISYVVLSSGGFLGFREKYLAIPPTAFSLPRDGGKMLILHADKATIENATGFVKTNWPDLESPEWGAGLAPGDLEAGARVNLQRDDDQAEGSATLRRDSHRESAVGGREAELEVRSDRYDRAADRQPSDRETFKGKITAINPQARTMTVEGESGSQTFKIAERPTLTLKENRYPRLTDFKVGYPVVIGFHREGDSHVAHSIIRADAPELK